MIRRIVYLNLKDTKDKAYMFIVAFVGMLITILQFRLIRIDDIKNLLMGNIIIQTYGGLGTDYNIILDVFSFILWFIPNILVIYLINISIVERARERITLVLPRVKSKKKWLIAYNLAIIIKITAYYLVLVLSSSVVIWFKIGSSAFKNSLICINNLTNYNIEQYIILIYIVLLNILTLIALQFFLNNLYYIFYNSNEAITIGILFFVLPVFFMQKNKWCNLLLINNGMIKRHEIFKNGLEGLDIVNSLVFIIIFIIFNFLIGLFLVKRKDVMT